MSNGMVSLVNCLTSKAQAFALLWGNILDRGVLPVNLTLKIWSSLHSQVKWGIMAFSTVNSLLSPTDWGESRVLLLRSTFPLFHLFTWNHLIWGSIRGRRTLRIVFSAPYWFVRRSSLIPMPQKNRWLHPIPPKKLCSCQNSPHVIMAARVVLGPCFLMAKESCHLYPSAGVRSLPSRSTKTPALH